MVKHTSATRLTLEEATRLREQACDLLNRLMVDREQSERRFAEAGKRDAMKTVTGRTALDCAVASTREMIQNMDALLAELQGEVASTNAAPRPQQTVITTRPMSWPGSRFAAKSPLLTGSVSAST